MDSQCFALRPGTTQGLTTVFQCQFCMSQSSIVSECVSVRVCVCVCVLLYVLQRERRMVERKKKNVRRPRLSSAFDFLAPVRISTYIEDECSGNGWKHKNSPQPKPLFFVLFWRPFADPISLPLIPPSPHSSTQVCALFKH